VAIASPQLFEADHSRQPSFFHRSPWFGWASELVHWVFSIKLALGLLPFFCVGCILPGDRQDLLKTMRSVPPETVLWRLSLVKEFDVDETQLRQLTQPDSDCQCLRSAFALYN